MSKSFARFLSYIFHPGIIPTILLGMLYFLTPYLLGLESVTIKYRIIILLFVSTYTLVFPGLFVLWLYRRKSIKSMHLQELSDRRLPYFFGIICTSFLAYFFYTKSGLQQSSVIISAILAALILITVISLFWQISAHAAGVGGLIGGLMGIIIHFGENYLNIPFFISLLIGGFVISARLKLNAHNPAQVIAGFACGFTCGLMGAYFL